MRLLSRAIKMLILLGFALSLTAMTGCVNMYVDNNLKEVDASQFKKPAPLHAAQFLFQFQTKGTANERATNSLKAKVLEQVKASGLFSEVSETPVAGNALLTITVNNVPLSDDAYSKGFVTGLTFGLAGTQVSDGYVCTARYMDGSSAPPLEKLGRHAIHSTVGAASAPPNGTKAASAMEAVTLMMKQLVSNVLNDLSRDPAFK